MAEQMVQQLLLERGIAIPERSWMSWRERQESLPDMQALCVKLEHLLGMCPRAQLSPSSNTQHVCRECCCLCAAELGVQRYKGSKCVLCRYGAHKTRSMRMCSSRSSWHSAI